MNEQLNGSAPQQHQTASNPPLAVRMTRPAPNAGEQNNTHYGVMAAHGTR
jgi:hypothetical protein